ncbi:serine hydrolase [Pseudoxanthomonas wuyuanensis]|uniref:Beta-lactamase class A n=1 Tax=Pseudoxanthomonas wuyuanensis TaxID=1073196 RepID=A0A286CYN6_9GAMM|nr:serine hydrolase [Pseudoxanthomonas wuyuanensis]KAF1722762.1 serine hydrolase [Pseudoxanthomonas wuyuanensis]SOD51511.1 beta-lactamase class A [Pseudoxanthomonas wuyuanensis]
MSRWLGRTVAIALMLALVSTACQRQDPAQREAVATDVPADAPAWVAALAERVERIDRAMPGEFGVYVKRLGENDGILDRGGDRRWYLSSTIKVPVAMAVLEQVDEGELALQDQRVLAESDFVDGSGDLIWQKPGSRYTVADLLEKSLQDSDSTATDMLIRLIGQRRLNQRVQAWSGGGFGPLTTIQQVRYDVYGAAHPGVAKLSNMDLVRLRNAEAGEPRLQALAQALGVPRSELDAGTLDALFENYYRRGDNSATLRAFAAVLEQLAAGQLLGPESRQRVLGHMRRISTGARRIQAGLPEGADFAQKTGTQIGRACNLGIIDPDRGRDGAVVVVACAERFDALAEAEQAFEQLGTALVDVGLVQAGAR